MEEMDFVQPATLADFLEEISVANSTILAGGTDLIPRMRRGTFEPVRLVDLGRVDDLHGISVHEGVILIGAGVTHREIEHSSVLMEFCPELVQAAGMVGSGQIRSRGTIGGNLANASPAADTAPALLARDADVVLVSRQGERRLAARDFFHGPGKTGLQAEEVILRVEIALPAGTWGSAYCKLGRRNGMAIAVASAAVYVELDARGSVSVARVAMGSVAEKPIRCPKVEEAWLGKTTSEADILEAAKAVQSDIRPISDLRASGDYRRKVSESLVARAMQSAAEAAKQRLK